MFHKPIKWVFDCSFLERSEQDSIKILDNITSFLERKERIVRRSLNCGTLSSEFTVILDPKLTALEHGRLILTPEMVEHSMNCTSQMTTPICKKKYFGSQFLQFTLTKYLSRPLDRARRVVQEQVSERILQEVRMEMGMTENAFQRNEWPFFEKKSRMFSCPFHFRTRSVPFYYMYIFHWVVIS